MSIDITKFAPMIVGYCLTVLGFFYPLVFVGILLIPFLYFVAITTSMLLTLSSSKKEILIDCIKLLPYLYTYLSKYVGVLLYPFVHFTRDWVYRTLGDDVHIYMISHGVNNYYNNKSFYKELGYSSLEEVIAKYYEITFWKLGFKEKIAKVLHWFMEDEEEMIDGIFSTTWVVEDVFPDYVEGTTLNSLEQYLVWLYWAGNRNITANFTNEMLFVYGEFEYECLSETTEDAYKNTTGIGIRQVCTRHERYTLDGKTYPQLTIISTFMFEMGFGSSRGFVDEDIRGFGSNLRLLEDYEY